MRPPARKAQQSIHAETASRPGLMCGVGTQAHPFPGRLAWIVLGALPLLGGARASVSGPPYFNFKPRDFHVQTLGDSARATFLLAQARRMSRRPSLRWGASTMEARPPACIQLSKRGVGTHLCAHNGSLKPIPLRGRAQPRCQLP